jgi:ABC-2 type transport system permease protein
MIGSLRRVVAVASKEVRQLSRDALTLGFVVGIPVIQLLLFGYAINQDVRHVATGVLDRSRTSASRMLVGELQATQTFDVTRAVASEWDGRRLLDRGEVHVVLVIPPDYARHTVRGRGAEVSVLVDATDPTVARAVRASAAGLARELSARVQPFASLAGSAWRAAPGDRRVVGVTPELIHPEPVRFSVLPYYNPELRTPVFVVPALVGVILTMTMLLMTALAIVRERERGTFEFLIATPVRRLELMLGKILPYLGIGALQVALILSAGVLIFDVPIRGSLVDLALGSSVFIAANLTLGLVISSAARSQFQAMQMAFFIFLPSILLSGFMFPFDSMPRPAQWLGEALPLTHFLRIVRGVVLRGAPLGEFNDEVGALGLILLFTLAIATRRFRKVLD